MRHSIALITLLLALAGRPTPTPTPQGDPPKPSVAISFERQAIRENDAVAVHIWIANEWDYGLTDVTLRADVPAPLKWNNLSCQEWSKRKFDGEAGDRPLPLDALKAHEVKSYTFCIKSGSEIDVGEFNIPFTFEYGWQRGAEARRSFTTSEKTLKANLFGSDSLAGVPLGLAGLIVPGLFFWVVFSLFRVGWMPWPSGDLALGDKLFFSVLASALLLFIVASFNARAPAFPNFSGGIGLPKLLFYVGVGAGAGLVVGGLIWVTQWVGRVLAARREERQAREALATEERRRRELARQVQLDDPLDVLLEKLLEKYPDLSTTETVVYLKNGTSYTGTLGEEGESATALVGSYFVNLEGLGQPLVDELMRAARPIDIFKIVRREKLEARLEPYQSLSVSKDGATAGDNAGYRTWPGGEVLRIELSPVGGDFAPLRLP
jgi:uncharacterized integral membrane protein